MITQFEAKYGIDDVVYRANEGGVSKEVIRAVKFTDKDGGPEYGFERDSSAFALFMYDRDYRWFGERSLLDDKASAEKLHQALKKEADARALDEEKAKRSNLIAEYEEKIAALRNADPDEVEADHV